MRAIRRHMRRAAVVAAAVVCAFSAAAAWADTFGVGLVSQGQDSRHYYVHGALFWGLVALAVLLVAGVAVRILLRRETASRQLAERQIETHRQHLDVIVRNAGFGILVLRRGEIVYTNGTFCDMAQRPLEDVLGAALGEFLEVRPDPEGSARADAPVDEEGEHEAELRRAGGEPMLVRVRVTRVDWEGDSARLAFVWDVTRRRRDEERLRLSRFSIEHAGLAIMWIVPDGRIVFANEAARDLFGYGAEEFRKLALYDIHISLDEDKWPAFWRAHTSSYASVFEMLGRTKYGSVIPVEVSCYHLRFGNREYLFAFGHDVADRKRTEAALRESEERFRRLFLDSPIGALVVDVSGRILSANEAFCDSVGYDPGELTVMSHLDITHPDDEPQCRRELEELLEGNETMETKKRFLHRSGAVVWCRQVVRLIRDANEAPLYFILLEEDITESLQMEHQLAMQRRAVEQSPVSAVVTDANWRIEYANPRYVEAAGSDADAVRGAVPGFLDAEGELRAAIEARVADGETWKGEVAAEDPDGERRVENVTVSGVVDENGATTHYVAVIEDVTEQREAAERLGESEALFREYFEMGLVGMAITSPDKHWGIFNDKLCEMLGYTREELMETTWTKVTHPDDVEKDVALFNRVVAGEIDRYSLDKRFIRKDGEVVHAMINVGCSRRPDGTPDHFVAHIMDVTEQRRAEAELRRRTQVEGMVSAVSSSFIAVAPGDFRRVVQSALAQLCRFLEAELGALYEVEDGIATVSQQWRSGDAPALAPEETVVEVDGDTWWRDALASRSRVVREHERPGARGPGGALAVPLSWLGNTFGVLVVEHAPDRGPWRGDEFLLTETFANILAQAIEGKKAEDSITRSLAVKEALERLYRPLAEPAATLPEICQMVLSEVRELTDSPHGYVGIIEEGTGDLLAYTLTEMLGAECRVRTGDPVRFAKREDGEYPALWGHSLNTLEPMIHDCEQEHPASGGLPKGHVPLTRVLAVPVLLGGELVGQVALANKEVPYNDHDLDAVQQVAGMFALAIQRVRYTRAVQESEERYRSLVETMHEGLFSEDADHRVTFANHQFIAMLGISRKEVVGRPILDYVHPQDLDAYEREASRRRRGQADPYEIRWNTQGGVPVRTLVAPTPLFDETGGYTGSFSVVMDVTRMRTLEAQLQQALKLESIGQLAAGIAHEINTPSQYVENNTRYLESAFEDMEALLDLYARYRAAVEGGEDAAALGTDLDRLLADRSLDELREDVPDAIEDALEGLSRITAIVHSVKQFAHPGQERKAPVDLNGIVRDAVTVSTNEWKYDSEMRTELDDDLPLVPGVQSQLNQVLLNLVVNAAAANSEKVEAGGMERGEIVISTGVEDGMAVLTVADNGTGIPESIRESVFNPFFTTKEPGRGTGQGLAIAHTVVVEKHGGRISFDTTPGEGTTFTVELPLADPEGGNDD